MCRKLIYLVSFILVLGLTLMSTASADLIGYWPLDEGSGTTVADVSGAGHNGFFAEGTPEWVEGMFGTALEFDGTNKVEIPDHADFHLEDAVSIALWAKPEADVQPEYAKFFCKQKSEEYPYGIQYRASGQILRATVNASARFDTSGIPNFPGEWAHLCMTYDGSAVILYKDGEEVGRRVASGKLQQNDLSLSIGGRLGYADTQNFVGIIDDVRLFSHALTKAEILKVMEGPPAGPPSKPNPAGGATDVPRDVVLSWTPGEFAAPVNGHKVYFNENFSDVNDGVGGITQDANNYAPQRLAFGTTYYWRIDEVNGPPDYAVYPGRIWSFTTELFVYPIENVTATASSSDPNKGPENTVNGSGLDDSGLLHSEDGAGNMWLSGSAGPQPTWIEYEFDKVYKLYEMWVWNYNEGFEPAIDVGFKDVTIEYSTNDTDWTTLAGIPQFAQAPGTAGYAHNTTVDLAGVPARYVRLTANSNFGGASTQYGLSEVRFFYIPVNARGPNPADGATDVSIGTIDAPVDVTIGFIAGREAAKHDVYFGTDEQAVMDGTAPVVTMSQSSYGPLSLDLGSTYYWRVDEVNEAETPTTWQGDLWDFATQQYLVVDDFESYNDIDPTEPESNRIFNVWKDGYEVPTNGSLIGYDMPPFAEQSNVYSGKQAMPFFYDNSGTARYSEAELTLSPAQDWTKHGITVLSLKFSGDPSNTADKMYVKVNGSKVVYDGDAADITRGWYEPWNIDVASFGTSLQNVTKLSIGVGDETSTTPGGSGKVLFDDIQLYRSIPVPPEGIWIEAEAADSITSPMEIFDHPAASGDKCIGTTDDVGNSGDVPPSPDGTATYTFTVEGGIYKVTCRIIIPSGDSFWVRIPGATNLTPGEDPGNPGTGWVRWFDPDNSDHWYWAEVFSGDHDDVVANWTLPAGTHTLEIAYREDGALLDAIVISKVD